MKKQDGSALALPSLRFIITGMAMKDGAGVHSETMSSTAAPARGGMDGDLEMATVEFEDGEELGGEEPVSPTSMIFHEPRIHNTILAVVGTSKRIDIAHAKAAMEATLARHPRFSSLQVWHGGKAKWVRSKVNVDNHIIVPNLNLEDIPLPDLFIDEYLSSLSATTLDFSKPLWELHILNIPTSEAEATAVFRIHHSIGDGISLVSLLIACCTRSNDGALPVIPQKRRRATTTKGTGAPETRWLRGMVTWFIGSLAMVWSTFLATFLLLFTWLGWIRDTETPMKAGNGLDKCERRRYVSMTVSLEDLKIIKRAANATINDVLLGFVSAGIYRYLNRRYSNLGCSVPKNIHLRSAVMVNLRNSLRVQVFPDTNSRDKVKSQWGNRIGFLLVPLPIVKFNRALDYVKSVKVVADRKKSSMESSLTSFCAFFLTKVLGTKIVAAMLCRVHSNITMLFSNIPGPSKGIEFLDYHVSHSSITVYGLPQALSIHCLSYTDKMKIYLSVDERVIPDPHQLRKEMLQSLNDIKDDAISLGDF